MVSCSSGMNRCLFWEERVEEGGREGGREGECFVWICMVLAFAAV